MVSPSYFFDSVIPGQPIPALLDRMVTLKYKDDIQEVYDIKPIFDKVEGFGFSYIRMKAPFFNSNIMAAVKKAANDRTTKGTSQPVSMFGGQCDVDGRIIVDATAGYTYPIKHEWHKLYQLRSETLYVKKHIEDMYEGEDPWTAEEANWTMRCGASVVKQTQGKRLEKLLTPSLQENYAFIKKVHNTVVLTEPRLRELSAMTTSVFNNLLDIKIWTVQDWVTNISPNAKSKESGPQFAQFMLSAFDKYTIQRVIEAINESITIRNDRAGTKPGMGGEEYFPNIMSRDELDQDDDDDEDNFTEEDVFKWSWRFTYNIFRSELVLEGDQIAILQQLTLWYSRMTADIWALYLLEAANIHTPYPELWSQWTRPIILMKKIAGITGGSRDCAKITEIKWNIPAATLKMVADGTLPHNVAVDGSLEVLIDEDADRRVTREGSTCASAKSLRNLLDLAQLYTHNMLITSGSQMATALSESVTGADGSCMDSVTGAAIGLVSYAKTWKQSNRYDLGLWMLSIGMGSGRPETMVYNTWLLTIMWTAADLIKWLVYIVGDDQGLRCNLFEIEDVIKNFNKFFEIDPGFEFIKKKQAGWISKTKKTSWKNFILGLSVKRTAAGPQGSWRAIKTLATKQAPTGMIKFNVWDAQGWQYTETRDAPSISSIWNDQHILYVGVPFQSVLDYLRKTNLTEIVRNLPDAPGFMHHIVSMLDKDV